VVWFVSQVNLIARKYIYIYKFKYKYIALIIHICIHIFKFIYLLISLFMAMSVYYVYIYLHTCILYIYVYIHRHVSVLLQCILYIYIYIYLSICTCVMVKMAPWITTVVAMFFPSVFPHFDNIWSKSSLSGPFSCVALRRRISSTSKIYRTCGSPKATATTDVVVKKINSGATVLPPTAWLLRSCHKKSLCHKN